MPFTPFPPDLLVSLTALPTTATPWGCEMLPFGRWLSGHFSWREVAIMGDGSGLAAPILAVLAESRAECHNVGLAELSGLRPESLDFIYVAADFPDEDWARLLKAVARSLAVGGVMLLQHAPRVISDAFAGVALPIGDGVMLLRRQHDAVPLLDWLCGLSTVELAGFGAFFEALGTQLTELAKLAPLRDAILQNDRERDALTVTIEQLRQLERHGNAELLRTRNERDSYRNSTSWRITAPLRKAVGLAARASRVHEAQTSEPSAICKDGDALWDFLTSGQRLSLPAALSPAISIVVHAQGSAAQVYRCLLSISQTVAQDEAEVVIVADEPTGELARLLGRLDGGRVVTNGSAFDTAVRTAEGRAVLLLDGGVELLPRAASAALAVLDATPDAGVVGAKVLAGNGAVLQAGEILCADGQLHGYAFGQGCETPEAQFRRNVASCSGGFLLVRSSVLRELGGLNPAFSGTRWASADLCVRLRDAGWGVVYEPLAEIRRDGWAAEIDAGDDKPMAALFATRHANSLAQWPVLPSGRPLDRRMLRDRQRVLVIDDRVPYPKLGAGYPRAARLIHELHQLGWFITFYPNVEFEDDWKAVYEAFPREVEFMLGWGRHNLPHFLHERDGYYDAVLVSRPHNMRDYLAGRGQTARPARLVYDAEAVFATREFLRLEQAGRPVPPDKQRAMLKEEIGLTETAHIVSAVSEAEADIFRGAGCPNVAVLGLGVEPRPVGTGFAFRRDILFVGALGEDLSPNADAVAWFVNEIMPPLDRLIGTDYRFLVAGRCRAPRIRKLASQRVQLLGLVDDLTPLYASARLFVAPIRYAAGLPLKVQEAVGHGLPVVGTGLLAQQLGWRSEQELLVASTAAAFADCCARLYCESALWYSLRRQGLDRLRADVRANDFVATLRTVLGQGELTLS